MTSDDKNKGIGSMDNDDAIDIEEAVSGVGADDDMIDVGDDDEMDMDGGEDFSFDVNEKQKGGGLKKILAPALVLVAAAGVGGYIVMNPDILTKFMGGASAPVQQQAMSSPSAFGDAGAPPAASPELPQPAGAAGDLPVPEVTDMAAMTPEQPMVPETTQPLVDDQMPRGPEEVLDVTAATPEAPPESPIAAPDQTAMVDTTGQDVWQAPEPEAQPAPTPAPEVVAEAAPVVEPVAVAAAPEAPVVESPMDANGAALNAEAPSAPGDVPATPLEMGSADDVPAVQTAAPSESVPPEMPVATSQPVEIPPAAAQQPAAPAALTPQGTMAQVTPPGTAAPRAGSGDAYYDAGINLPRGPIAKETIREVDPSVEPGQKMIIAKKDYNQSSQEALLESASRALKLQRYDAALEMYEQLYAKNKRDRRILMGLAVSQQYAGRTEAAIQTYETLLDIDPKNAGAMVNMLGLLRAQYPEVALRRLMDLQERFPGNAGIAAQIGLTQAELGHYDDAVRYMQMAASLEPRNAQHLFNLAVIADRKGAAGDAVKYYEQALEADAVYSGGKSLPRETIYDRLAKLRRN